MVRWLIRGDARVLQYFDANNWKYDQWGAWIDVPEISEHDALILEQKERERKILENERTVAALKGKTYTIR